MKTISYELYKYQAAGNDFLIADNRQHQFEMTPQEVAKVCDRHYGIGADGLMLLEPSKEYDFEMTYFNSDGSTGMMCGNGALCLVAFAEWVGIRSFRFKAADGVHSAEILSRKGREETVKLSMKDIEHIEKFECEKCKGELIHTGAPNIVIEVEDVQKVDVEGQGKALRWHAMFQPEGVNVNFIQPQQDGLRIRSYEKGVEGETYSCGTGVVAAVIGHYHRLHPEIEEDGLSRNVAVIALRDKLAVEFVPTKNGAKDVYLIGPATYVAKIIM